MATILADDHGRPGLRLSEDGRLDAPPARRQLSPYALPAPTLATADIEHVFHTGQSNGIGWGNNAPDHDRLLATQQNHYGSLMLAEGLRYPWNNYAPDATFAPLVPWEDNLPGTPAIRGLFPSFGMGDLGRLLLEWSAPQRPTQYLVGAAGIGGASIGQLLPGGDFGEETFYHGVRQTHFAKVQADALGLTYHQAYHLWIHGESDLRGDSDPTTAEDYAAWYRGKLVELYEAINGRGTYSPSAAHLAVTAAVSHKDAAGQADDIRLYVAGLSSDTIGMDRPQFGQAFDGLCPLLLAQYRAHRDDAGITLVCPTYMERTWDGQHHSAALSHLVGQYAAWAYHAELTTGRVWQGVAPDEASVTVTESGGTYTVSVRVHPAELGDSLEFDTVNVPRAPRMGFNLIGADGSLLQATEPVLTDRNLVTITTSEAAPAYLTYAMLHIREAACGITGHRGNLRSRRDYSGWNTAARTSGRPLAFFHWCLPFAIDLT